MTSAFNGSEMVVYGYDALGRRVTRTEGLTNNTTFTHDGQDVILDTSWPPWNPTTLTYQNGPGIDKKLSYKSTSGGGPFGPTIKRRYLLPDHLGSTTGVTNESGSLNAPPAYDSFGNRTGPLDTRYGYTGREFDSFSGLYYYRARMYDPQIGRFISEDPIGFEGGDVNLYGYVHSNPINKRDPFGLIDPIVYQDPRMYGASDPTRAERVQACYRKWKFSSVASFGDPTAESVLEYVEIGSVSSLALDSVAIARKAAGPSTASSNVYASGINMLAKDVSRISGFPSVFKAIRPIGDKATPVLAVTGAGTFAYNATIDIQCACGIID
jgi:RHS repeat-associated protein